MEKSCKIQLEVDAAAANGLQKHIISDEEAAYNFKMASESVGLSRKSGVPYYSNADDISGDFVLRMAAATGVRRISDWARFQSLMLCCQF